MSEDQQNQEQQQAPSFEAWLGQQGDDIKVLYEGHTKGLRTALESERDARKTFEKQVRDLAAKADAGSEAQKNLQQMADQIGALTRQQQFYDEAHSQGVSNLKLAYLAATDAGLIDDRGLVNWERLKSQFPQLFGATGVPPKANAGAGTQQPPTGRTMNDFIRRAAGRQ